MKSLFLWLSWLDNLKKAGHFDVHTYCYIYRVLFVFSLGVGAVIINLDVSVYCLFVFKLIFYLPILHRMILFKRRYSSRVSPMLVNFLHIFLVSESNSMAQLCRSASPTVNCKSSASLSVPL